MDVPVWTTADMELFAVAANVRLVVVTNGTLSFFGNYRNRGSLAVVELRDRHYEVRKESRRKKEKERKEQRKGKKHVVPLY